MGRINGHGKLSKKTVDSFPKIFIYKDNNIAAIKIAKGIEHKSYEKTDLFFVKTKLVG